jgi:hypothetical protein
VSVVERGEPDTANEGQTARLGHEPVGLVSLSEEEYQEVLERLRVSQGVLNRLVSARGSLLEIAQVLEEHRQARLRLLGHAQLLSRRGRFEEEEQR